MLLYIFIYIYIYIYIYIHPFIGIGAFHYSIDTGIQIMKILVYAFKHDGSMLMALKILIYHFAKMILQN